MYQRLSEFFLEYAPHGDGEPKDPSVSDTFARATQDVIDRYGVTEEKAAAWTAVTQVYGLQGSIVELEATEESMQRLVSPLFISGAQGTGNEDAEAKPRRGRLRCLLSFRKCGDGVLAEADAEAFCCGDVERNRSGWVDASTRAQAGQVGTEDPASAKVWI